MKDQNLESEVSKIVAGIIEAVERHANPGELFHSGADIDSELLGRREEIGKAVEASFPHSELYAIVDVEVHSTSLNYSVFYPPRYRVDMRDGRWFVDSTISDCWYFETSDEGSALALSEVVNSAPHASNLLHLRPNIGIDEDSLKLWLLGLRDKGVLVTTFAHKGTGIFNRNNVLS